jgi:CSLREA domain-containing protein
MTTAATLLAALVVAMAPSAAHADTPVVPPAGSYEFTDLGAGLLPTAVNDHDDVAATYLTPLAPGGYNRDDGALWHNGTVTLLQGPDGASAGSLPVAETADINDAGLIAGQSTDSDGTDYEAGSFPATWTVASPSAAPHNLGAIPTTSDTPYGAAQAVNASDDVVSGSGDGAFYSAGGAGGPVAIGTAYGSPHGVDACGISDDGHIVAMIRGQAYDLPGATQTGSPIDFTLPYCGNNGIGQAHPMASDGTIVGTNVTGSPATTNVVVRSPAGVESLYPTSLTPTAVNADRLVVGTLNDGTHAALLHNGTVTDLSLQFPAETKSSRPIDVNDLGDIVGSFTDKDNVQHGFLLKDKRTIVVNSTADNAESSTATAGQCDTGQHISGGAVECTLRAALKVANSAGTGTINFNIPGGGTPTITPASELPAITATITLDGTTQPGGWVQVSGNPTLDSSGIAVNAGGPTIRGLVLNGWPGAGINVKGGTGTLIVGNRLGTNAAGTASVPNGAGALVGAPGVTIGGTSGTTSTACTGDCNLISGNDHGGWHSGIVVISHGAATVLGDYIGTDVTGLHALPNYYGITDNGSVNGEGPGQLTVGGATANPGTAPGNLISGNLGTAIVLAGAHDTVAGNLMGENRTGSSSLEPTAAAAEFTDGIGVVADNGTATIGGPVPADRNVIGGFPRFGINRFEGDNANVIAQNDRIGTSLDGMAAVANGVGTERISVVKDSLISGNATVGIDESDVVTGNLIGTTADGRSALPNQIGVAKSGQVGGERAPGSRTCAAPCNVISGNTDGAVSGTKTVQGNFIGTDDTGAKAIPNGHANDPLAAVEGYTQLGGASHAVERQVCDLACNLISGNATSAAGGGDKAFGNVIGTTLVGLALPNHGAGIRTSAYEEPVIGGDVGLGNLIANSTGAAIEVADQRPPTVQGNTMFGNAGGGIVVDASDHARRVARPVTAGAVATAGTVSISGQVNDLVSSDVFTARIDAYASTSCANGPQGELPIGHVGIGPITDGSWTIVTPRPASYLPYVTVTSTEAGATSPFSECVAISGASTINPQPGQRDTVQAPGFAKGEHVDVTLHSTPQHLTTVTATSSGLASATVTIPKSTPAGQHHLIFTGAKSKHVISVPITVTPAPQAGLLHLLTATKLAHKRIAKNARIALAGHAGIPRKGARHVLLLAQSTVAAHIDGHAIPAHGSALLVVPLTKAKVTVKRPGSVTLIALGWYASAKSSTGDVLRRVHPAAVGKSGTLTIAGTRGLPFSGLHAVVVTVHTRKAATTVGGVRLAASKKAQSVVAKVTDGRLAVHLGRGATATITGWYGSPAAAPGGKTTG